MNRDEGAHYLSHVYDPHLATSEPSADQSSRRGDEDGSIPIIALKMATDQVGWNTVRLGKLNGFDNLIICLRIDHNVCHDQSMS